MSTVTDLESYQQFALQQQAQNNAWSAEQAQKQMDFQREMSNSAHQREVADLKAAGLNPILSVNSGASVPNGAAGDTDTSAAGNVGAILQQVLQAQSAREVAAMYNAATINAASIAANASMYGSDMSYWNTEDHPKTVEEMIARAMLEASHPPEQHNSGSSVSSGSGSSGSGSSDFHPQTFTERMPWNNPEYKKYRDTVKNSPIYSKTGNYGETVMQRNALAISNQFNSIYKSLSAKNKLQFGLWLKNRYGLKAYSSASVQRKFQMLQEFIRTLPRR